MFCILLLKPDMSLCILAAQRQTGETSPNGTSSRSHQIIRLVLLFISLVFPYKVFSVASLGILTFIYLDRLIPQKIESSARDLSGNDNPSTLIAAVVCYIYRERRNKRSSNCMT